MHKLHREVITRWTCMNAGQLLNIVITAVNHCTSLIIEVSIYIEDCTKEQAHHEDEHHINSVLSRFYRKQLLANHL